MYVSSMSLNEQIIESNSNITEIRGNQLTIIEICVSIMSIERGRRKARQHHRGSKTWTLNEPAALVALSEKRYWLNNQV